MTQLPGFLLPEGQHKVEIPFVVENDFIIVNVLFNNLPLRFIFDTGAEHSIITKREFSDLLQIEYQKEFRILGADMKSELIAYLIRGVNLKIGSVSAKNQNLLVLEEDYFRFEEYMGTAVHGILGCDMFRYFVVKIDWKRRVITLFKPEKFSKPKNVYVEIPVDINSKKPYILVKTTIQDKTVNMKLLMDTGASLALILHNNIPNLKFPEEIIQGNIGMGLGGFMNGVLGRVNELKIENFSFKNIVTNFQDVSQIRDTSYFNGRHGILGNQILNRFTLILDFPKEKLYLKPNKLYSKKFKYDRSGISLVASGLYLNKFNVDYIIADSPANLAGLKIGDRLIKINGLPASLYSLEKLNRFFQKKENKKIRLIIKRNEKKIKVKFRLKELI